MQVRELRFELHSQDKFSKNNTIEKKKNFSKLLEKTSENLEKKVTKASSKKQKVSTLKMEDKESNELENAVEEIKEELKKEVKNILPVKAKVSLDELEEETEDILEILLSLISQIINEIPVETDDKKLEDGDANDELKLIVSDLLESLGLDIEADNLQNEDIKNEVMAVIAALPKEEKVELLSTFEEKLQTVVEAMPVEGNKKDTIIDVKSDAEVEHVELKEDNAEKVEFKEIKPEAKEEKTDSKRETKAEIKAEVKEAKESVKVVPINDRINLMQINNRGIVTEKTSLRPQVPIVTQLDEGIKMNLNLLNEGSEVVLKLNPRNLGNVALKMVYEKGEFIAQIQVENQTVKGVIESSLSDLKSSLSENGYHVAGLDVSVSDNKSENQSQNPIFEQFRRNRVFLDDNYEEFIFENIYNKDRIDYLG